MTDLWYGIYDPDKKKPPALKAQEAVAAYVERYGHAPSQMLVGEGPPFEAPLGVTVVTVDFIPENTFYLGMDEHD